MRWIWTALFVMLSALPHDAQTMETSQGTVAVTRIAGGLNAPWGFGFLPDGTILITERGGKLKRVADGTVQEVAGVGPVWAEGQGGLLDVLVPRDFSQSEELFFTLAQPQRRQAGTAVARAGSQRMARGSPIGQSFMKWMQAARAHAISAPGWWRPPIWRG